MDDLAPDQHLTYRARMLAEGARSLEGVLTPRAAKRAKETIPERAGEWLRAATLVQTAMGELTDASAILGKIAEDRPDLYIRTGGFIGLASGGMFFPMDPRPEEVKVRDLVHSLWRRGRWNGHASRFFSTGEHCLRGAFGAAALARLAGLQPALAQLAVDIFLLHDGSDAYLPDIPTPVKPFVPGWRDIEAAVQDAIYQRFGITVIPYEVDLVVEEVDRFMKITEALRFFSDEARAKWGDWVRAEVPAEFEKAAWELNVAEATEGCYEGHLNRILDTAEAKVKAGRKPLLPSAANSRAWEVDAAKVSADAFEPPPHLKALLEDGK